MAKALIELKPGEKGRVVRIRGRGDFHRRLMAVGLTVGCTIQIMAARCGDCVEVKVRGDNVSLRSEEAAGIYVEMM